MKLLRSIMILGAALPYPSYASDMYFKDGDSFILPSGVEVRLHGIDAAEYDQICYRRSLPYQCGLEGRAAFIEILGGRIPKCKTLYLDKDNRKVSRCEIDGQDLGYLMVRSGYALDYEYFSKGYYADAQNMARNENKGLWSGQFIEPWVWRRQKRKKR